MNRSGMSNRLYVLRRLTPWQSALAVIIALSALALAILIVGSLRNTAQTRAAFDAGYAVTDFSDIQRDVFRLQTETEKYLSRADADVADVQLQRALLANKMRLALATAQDNPESLTALQEMQTNLDQYDRLLDQLLENPSAANRLASQPGFDQIFAELTAQVIGFYSVAEQQLFPTIRTALGTQRSFQLSMLALSALLLIANVLLALSLRTSIGSEFSVAYERVAVELEERQRVEAALRVAKDEAEEANRAKSEFVSLVTHELRLPMSVIQGYIELLIDESMGELNSDRHQYLVAMRSSIFRMVKLVSDLADVSRIESGRLTLEPTTLPLRGIVKEILEMLEVQFEAKQQRVHLEVALDLPHVEADRMRLHQILSNLLTNANKYTPVGGDITVRAELTYENQPAGGRRPVVCVAVSDTGIGIRPEHFDQIFQKFYRASEPGYRHVPGTGLGLNIARYLVEMHGGKIWFESDYGHGSTFYFTLPAVLQSESVTA